MQRVRAVIFAALAAAVVFAPVSFAGAPEGLDKGPSEFYVLTDSPFSGPVEVIVQSNHPTPRQGSLTDVFLAVQNHSNEATVSVNIDLELRYADGTAVQPFHLGQDRVAILGPDEGVAFFIFWQIPADAPLGPGLFRVNARVGRITGGDDNHSNNENPMVASDSVSFEVVP